jgi:hypothetical protein
MWNPALRSDLRSATSPELAPRLAAAALLVALAVAGGCSNGARSVRLPALSPGDEIYRVTCETSIAACREEASKVCAGSYQVLESTGAPVQPTRVTSAPGPSSTGPRYQRLAWIGQLVIACGRGTPPVAEDAVAGPQHEARTTAPDAPPPDRLCIPGVTQECLGPGACRGAQACLADGNGYGPCDCGNASTHAQPHSPLDVADGGVPAHHGTDD